MPAANQRLSKYDVLVRLLHLMDNLTEEQQFLIFKQLFKGGISNQLIKRIIDMSENQRLILLKHLEEVMAHANNGEKRKHARKNCLINVNFEIKGPRFNSYILDINPYGAFIETNESFSVGQEMRLTFASPDSRESLNIISKVIRTDSNGVGVRFHRLTRHELSAIRSFVENGEAVYEITS
jgi:Tfp pilus assembly protein PilZ